MRACEGMGQSISDSNSECEGPEVGKHFCWWGPGLCSVEVSRLQTAHSLEVPSEDLGFSLRATGDSRGRKREKHLGVQRTA